MGRRAPREPDWVLVRELFAAGHGLVAGLDEVGRGAWAGPVAVGVAVVDPTCVASAPPGVRDSKLLAPSVRERLFVPLTRWCRAFAVGQASAGECDALGMTGAQRLAASRAMDALGVTPDAVVVDGKWEYTGIEGARPVVGADLTCYPVAAASILAKVTRDRLMAALGAAHPGYGFERHKGYVSKEHRCAVHALGMTEFHRRSWSVVSQAGLVGDTQRATAPRRSFDRAGGL